MSTTASAQVMPLDQLRSMLRRGAVNVFAVLDACDEPRVPSKMREWGERATCLYKGAAERDYWAIAPYLAAADDELLQWITGQLGADPWGILLSGPQDLTTVARHLRRFLMVRLPDGRQAYFRFYDPRVLPAFLESCTAEQRLEFFGPLQWLAVLDGDNAMLFTAQQAASGPNQVSPPVWRVDDSDSHAN